MAPPRDIFQCLETLLSQGRGRCYWLLVTVLPHQGRPPTTARSKQPCVLLKTLPTDLGIESPAAARSFACMSSPHEDLSWPPSPQLCCLRSSHTHWPLHGSLCLARTTSEHTMTSYQRCLFHPSGQCFLSRLCAAASLVQTGAGHAAGTRLPCPGRIRHISKQGSLAPLSPLFLFLE